MADSKAVIGAMFQDILAGSSRHRINHALSGRRSRHRSGGALGQILGGQSSGSGGLLGELAKVLVQGQTRRTTRRSSSGGLLGSVLGSVLGGGRRRTSTKSILGGSAMSLLAALAFEALKNRGSTSTRTTRSDSLPLGLRAPSNTHEERQLQARADLILKAMISAAKADGHIDDTERDRILGQLDKSGADSDQQRMVLEAIRHPLGIEEIARQTPNAEAAAEVYAASLLAIEVNNQAERDYLRRLARALGLDREAVDRLHDALDVEPLN